MKRMWMKTLTPGAKLCFKKYVGINGLTLSTYTHDIKLAIFHY